MAHDCADRVGSEEAQAKAQEKHERAGLTALLHDVDRAHTAWWRAALHMARTKPCTSAGARAMLTETLKDVQMAWCETALGTVVQALAAMEAASPRSPIMKAA
jgi:hypothetical protein